MVYMSTGPIPGVEWGGWHITIAGQHDYAMNLGQFSRLVSDAIPGLDDVNGGTWKMNGRNSEIESSQKIKVCSNMLREFAQRLGVYGVKNVKTGHLLHVTLNSSLSTNAEYVRDSWITPKGPRFSVYINDGSNKWTKVSNPLYNAPMRGLGAGTVLVEWYKQKGGRSGLSVILFRENGKYTDAGGKRDTNNGVMDSSLITAQRELKEESLGLFRLDISKMSYDIIRPWPYYEAYFVPVKCDKGISKEYYKANYGVTQKNNSLPSCWKETDDMTRFFLEDLIDAGIMNTLGDLSNASDVYGSLMTIDGRAKAAIREFINLIIYRRGISEEVVKWNSINVSTKCDRGLGEYGTQVYNATKGLTNCYWS